MVTLSPFWLRRAREVGRARHAYAVKHDLKHYGNIANDHESHHEVGAIAEAAVAKYLHLPWRANIGNIKGVDVGNVVEVRARRIPGTGTDLAIRPNDKDDKPYVLAWVHADDSVEIVGWLFGREGKNRGPWSAAKQVWFNPPPYRPIEQLLDIIS